MMNKSILERGKSLEVKGDRIMAKKLFAFLGIGDYKSVEYYFQNKNEGYKTEYIQEAITKLLDEQDLNVTVFVTEEARKKHWEPESNIGLKSKLEKLNINCKAVDIPDGKANNDVWKIFLNVYNEIDINDEIYVDVTHSLRNIPIIFMSVLNYAKVAKNCIIKGIFYGAYEAKENDRAPIYDLTLFDQIGEWSSGVEQLLMTGECEMFCSTVEKTLGPLLREAKGTDELIKLVKKCSKLIKEFYTDLKLVRGKSVLEDGRKLYQVLCEIKALNTEKHITIQPFFHILEQVENQVAFFQNENLIENILECVKLCKKFGQYQQAYTFLRENIINYVCINTGLDWEKEDPDRLIAEELIGKLYAKNIKKLQIEIVGDIKTILENRGNFISDDTIELFGELIEFRNDLDHAQFRMVNPSKDKFACKLDSFIERFEKYYIS